MPPCRRTERALCCACPSLNKPLLTPQMRQRRSPRGALIVPRAAAKGATVLWNAATPLLSLLSFWSSSAWRDSSVTRFPHARCYHSTPHRRRLSVLATPPSVPASVLFPCRPCRYQQKPVSLGHFHTSTARSLQKGKPHPDTMVHVAKLDQPHYEDTIMTGGPVLNLDGLLMKPSSALPTPPALDDDETLLKLHRQQEDHLPDGIRETEEEESHHWFVGSIDQGTTSSRFLIFNGEGDPVATHQIEFENLYPKSGWHEQDPYELLGSVEECIDKAMRKFADLGYSKRDIKAIGITNQRETTVVWDSTTGEPLCNAIVWPDTRTAALVRELKSRESADSLMDLCGLPLSTYPSSVKLLWLLQNNDSVKQAYEEGRLAFGTVDSWLIYKLNGGAQAEKPVHVTDSTNASRTMFMNLRTLQYDDKLLGFFGIDRNKIKLPKIVPSSDPECFGKVASGPLAGIPIAGCLGDQSSALVGQCGFSPGQAKNTYGTGSFILYNVGEEPVISKYGLLATIAYDFGRGRKPVYALEGSIAVAGSGVTFLINNFGFAAKPSEITKVAESVPDNGGVVFVTAFSGLFAPYWIDDAKGTLFGITQHTTKGHIARATLEATCYQTRAILEAMEKDSGHKLQVLAVDGGLSNSDLCMQTQADISGIPVDRPRMRETTALGAAIAAGLATGVWKELEDLKQVNRNGRKVFEPQMDKAKADKMFRKWEQAVEMSRGWNKE